MNAVVLLVVGVGAFVCAYALYGGYLAKKWRLDNSIITPAHTLRDDIDYCPADAKVILGHHFSSIAGAGPITGPIQAIIFGWLPVYLWVMIGSIFIGGVHDFGSIFASVRHSGKSIGEVIKANIGKTGQTLFNLFSWLTIVLVVAAFADICASTFAYDPANPENLTGAMAGTSSVLFIILAVVFGLLVYRRHANLAVSTVIGVLLMMLCIYLGYNFPVLALTKSTWTVIILIYIFCASMLPVWILLQPRDYLCSFLLYALLIGSVLGIFIVRPTVELPAFTGFVVGEGATASYLFPILFITVACGAISGFHSLVGSGTTSKQLNKEKDSKFVGYGGMLIEGTVAIIAIIAVAYTAVQVEGTPAVRFASGIAYFMNSFGIPVQVGMVFVTLSFSAFALTSLDTATRLGRYMFQELVGKEEQTDEKNTSLRSLLRQPMVATLITIAGAGGLLAYGYQNIWPIFGASNQLLAGLTLLALTAWFAKTGRGILPTLIPMIFMFVVTISALILLIKGFFLAENVLMTVMASALFILAIVLIAFMIRTMLNKNDKKLEEPLSKIN